MLARWDGTAWSSAAVDDQVTGDGAPSLAFDGGNPAIVYEKTGSLRSRAGTGPPGCGPTSAAAERPGSFRRSR